MQVEKVIRNGTVELCVSCNILAQLQYPRLSQGLTQRRSCASQTLARTRQKAAQKEQSEKLEISPELAKIRLRLGFYLRPRDYESHGLMNELTAQPQTLNKSQTRAANKTMNRCNEISNATDRDYSKSATKQVNTFHFQ